MNEERHVMVLEKEYPSGEEDWYCPTCGRRFLVNWEPKFKRTVLQKGDEYAVHTGGKGGLQMGTTQPASGDIPGVEKKSVASMDDPRLAPWAAWLEEVGFENLWDDQA